MGEFANMMRQRAALAMREVFRQDATPRTEPLLELIGCLLADESEGPTPDSSLTAEQWMTWNQLMADRETEVMEAILRVAERERTGLPTRPEAMRAWAAWLVLSTLDEMEMQ
jgi:hypothetical protein